VPTIKATDFSDFSDPLLELVAACFQALSDPTRLKILRALKAGDRTVQELVAMFNCTQPNVSRHLSILLSAGLVRRKKRGARAYYRIANPQIFPLCDRVCSHVRSTLSELETGSGER
jgi:DNA-binding transcriptional ArsR family regulator